MIEDIGRLPTLEELEAQAPNNVFVQAIIKSINDAPNDAEALKLAKALAAKASEDRGLFRALKKAKATEAWQKLPEYIKLRDAAGSLSGEELGAQNHNNTLVLAIIKSIKDAPDDFKRHLLVRALTAKASEDKGLLSEIKKATIKDSWLMAAEYTEARTALVREFRWLLSFNDQHTRSIRISPKGAYAPHNFIRDMKPVIKELERRQAATEREYQATHRLDSTVRPMHMPAVLARLFKFRR